MRTATFWITEIDGTFFPYMTQEGASFHAGMHVDQGRKVGLVAYRVTVELPDEEA